MERPSKEEVAARVERLLEVLRNILERYPELRKEFEQEVGEELEVPPGTP